MTTLFDPIRIGDLDAARGYIDYPTLDLQATA
jgi:hypothetical protein